MHTQHTNKRIQNIEQVLFESDWRQTGAMLSVLLPSLAKSAPAERQRVLCPLNDLRRDLRELDWMIMQMPPQTEPSKCCPIRKPQTAKSAPSSCREPETFFHRGPPISATAWRPTSSLSSKPEVSILPQTLPLCWVDDWMANGSLGQSSRLIGKKISEMIPSSLLAESLNPEAAQPSLTKKQVGQRECDKRGGNMMLESDIQSAVRSSSRKRKATNRFEFEKDANMQKSRGFEDREFAVGDKISAHHTCVLL